MRRDEEEEGSTRRRDADETRSIFLFLWIGFDCSFIRPRQPTSFKLVDLGSVR